MEAREQILCLAKEYYNAREKKHSLAASGKVLDGDDIAALVDASLDGWLTAGRFHARFESALARFFGMRRALAVNSGSSANLIAFSALRLKPGDEVITVAAGFPTTVAPIFQNGCVPVFCDITLPTYNIDVSALEAAYTSKTRAIMLAHTLGNPFDIDAVMAFAKKYDLFVIEDCCDALGSTYNGQAVGTFGNIATLSFYPAHHITMGEGGAVLSNDLSLMKVAESFRDWGRDCYCQPGKDNTCKKRFCQQVGDLPFGYDHKYTYSQLGYNLKITDMQAAIGCTQLSKAPSFIEKRKKNFATLTTLFLQAGLDEYFLLPKAQEKSDPSWFGFPLTIQSTIDRRTLQENLDEKGVGTRLLFAGNMTRQPALRGKTYRVVGDLSMTDTAMQKTLWIGLWPGLEERDLEMIVDHIKSSIGVLV